MTPQAYQLERLTEYEKYLLDENEVCEKVAKKMKRFSTITSEVDIGLITSTFITEGVSTATF